MEENDTVVDNIEETAADFQRSDTSTGFEKVQNIIADTLHHVAETLNEKATNPDAHYSMAQYGQQASEWLDQSADYVRQFDYVQADTRVRKYVGKRPGLSLLIAGGVGLIIGAVLRRR